MTKKKKIWLIVGAVVVVVIIAILNLSGNGGPSYSVLAEKAKRGKITSLVTGTGAIQARTTVKISADVSAKIVDLPVEEGDSVTKGDLLVRLDQGRYLAAVRQAEAALASAKAVQKRAEASMIEAEQNLQRADKLYEQGLISEEDYVQIKTASEVARADNESAKHAVRQQDALLAQRQDELDRTVITSPISGTITELNAEEGEIVVVGTMNNPGTVIMTVADLSTIEVEVEVDETDIAGVRVGQDAKIEVDAFPDTTFRGRVTEVGNSAQVSGISSSDRVTNFLVTVLLLDDIPTIKPGMTATADITTDVCDNCLHVPIQAVVYRSLKEIEKKRAQNAESSGGAVAAELDSTSSNEEEEDDQEVEGVFRVVEGKVEFMPVVTGIADQQNIQIESGIDDGDEIVTGSYSILRTIEDGSAVTVKQEGWKDKKES
jgi:HlyD family secretion protein